MIPDHGIRQRGGRCLKAIYLNLIKLNSKFLIKHSGSVAVKLTEMKKNTRKPFHKPQRDTKHQVNHPFAAASKNTRIGQKWYLVIPPESPGTKNTQASLAPEVIIFSGTTHKTAITCNRVVREYKNDLEDQRVLYLDLHLSKGVFDL